MEGEYQRLIRGRKVSSIYPNKHYGKPSGAGRRTGRCAGREQGARDPNDGDGHCSHQKSGPENVETTGDNGTEEDPSW